MINKKQLDGAGEACWAHNPEVGGSKPPLATSLIHGAVTIFFFLLPWSRVSVSLTGE